MSRGPSFGEIFKRCLLSKCPVCGKGRLFAQLSKLESMRELFLPVEQCESCSFRFGRQPGYYFGVITPVLPVLALFSGAAWAGVAYFGFHQRIEGTLVWGGVGVGLGLFAFFRTAIAVYVALDHAIDPPG